VTTAPVALRAARARIGLRADAAALAGLALFVAALAAATWGTWGDLDSDTGYDVVAGARVADGEVPYRDFTYYYGPLAPYVMGLASLIGGSGFWPAVGLGFVVALGIIGVTYALARALVAPLGAFLAAALTAAVAFIPSNYSFVLPHTNAATLGTLLLLGVLLCAWRYAASERSRWAVGTGVCLGLAALTKPEPAVAGLLGVAVWLFLRSRSGRPARRVAALVATPAVAIPALVYGSLLTVVSPGVLLFENLWPRDELAAGGSELIRARMALTLDSVTDLLLQYTLPYAVGIAFLILLGRALEVPRWRRPLVAVTGGIAIFLVAACIARPDGLRDAIYYAWGWIPVGALVALVVLLVRFQRRSGEWTPRAQLELVGAVALVALAATTYNGFVVNGWRPTMSVYYVPLAALLIVRLHLVELARARTAYVLGVLWVSFLVAASTGLTLKDARAEEATVRGPDGALAETPAEAGLYQAALDEIAARTSPDEPILVAPLMTGLYPLSGHDSPLEKISMLPGALPHASDELAAIADLERAGVRLILTDRRDWPGYGHTSFGESFDPVLARWIERNFDRVKVLRTRGEKPRTLDVWFRRG
jgi:hypothetical protein